MQKETVHKREEEEKKKKKNEVGIDTITPSSTFSPSGHVCDGNVCTFNPDSGASFDSSSSFSGDTGYDGGYTDYFSTSKFENCVGDVCAKITEEKDCQMNEFGICEGVAESYRELGKKVFEKTKETVSQQVSQAGVSLGKSFMRTIGQTVVNFRDHKKIKHFLLHIIVISLLSTIIQFCVKTAYDVLVEFLAQFCCGDTVYEYVPGLDKIMMVLTFLITLKNGENIFIGAIFGVKEVGKIHMNVHLTKFFGTCCPEKMLGYHDYISILITSIIVNIVDNIFELIIKKLNSKKK